MYSLCSVGRLLSNEGACAVGAAWHSRAVLGRAELAVFRTNGNVGATFTPQSSFNVAFTTYCGTDVPDSFE